MSFPIPPSTRSKPRTTIFSLSSLFLSHSWFSTSTLSPPNSYHHCSSLLQSLVTLKSLNAGKQFHAHLILSGLGRNANLATKLVYLYSTTGHLSYAHNLFDQIPKRNLFLWNTLIRAYSWTGPYETAIELYHGLLDYGLLPDKFTFPFVLKACSALSALKTGREIHDMAVWTQRELDVFVAAGLIDMYAKCGCVYDARHVFDRVLRRDAVVWNSMIGAYCQNGYPSESLALFKGIGVLAEIGGPSRDSFYMESV